MSAYLERKSQALTRAVDILHAHKGFTISGIRAAETSLHDAGIDLTNDKVTELLKLNASFAAPEGVTAVGPTRSQLGTQIIRGLMPAVTLAESPIGDMFPVLSVNGTTYQQNEFGTGFGMAQPAGRIGGANQLVPMLKRLGRQYVGYPYTAMSELDGNVANTMRAMFSGTLNENGAMELCNYQLMYLFDMSSIGVVGRTIDGVKKGAFVCDVINGAPVYASTQGNLKVSYSSASLLSYNKTTNTVTNNTAYAGNIFAELTATMQTILNAGYIIDGMLMDNRVYTAMMQTPNAQNKMAYVSAVSSNNTADTQKNLFRIETIPELMNVPILVYSQGYKFAAGDNDGSNTRPLWWGEEVTSASFRVLFKVRNPNGSPIGNTAFYTNVLKDGMFSSVNTETDIALKMVDTTQIDPINPKIIMYSSTTFAPIVYKQTPVFVFDVQATVTA